MRRFYVTVGAASVCVRFIKDEPQLIEAGLRRCKNLTGTLYTLKRFVYLTLAGLSTTADTV